MEAATVSKFYFFHFMYNREGVQCLIIKKLLTQQGFGINKSGLTQDQYTILTHRSLTRPNIISSSLFKSSQVFHT